MQKENANFIIRGIRDSDDFIYEKIAHINKDLNQDIETYLFYHLKKILISSSLVKDVIKNNGDVKKFYQRNCNFYFK